MNDHNSHIACLPVILKAKGVEYIIISPGSRNAPLIQVFSREYANNCISIVDERSAAYFGLGIAIRTKKIVALISTSGSAALNYAPAIAEAYYQGVALLALTADRPREWIDMQDNQTIQQQNIYANNVKVSYTLPVRVNTSDDQWYIERIVNEACNRSISGKPGPVHLNIPLREPLYNKIKRVNDPAIIKEEFLAPVSLSANLKEKWIAASKILIVVGQLLPDRKINELVNKISEDNRVVVIAEPVSNISGTRIVGFAEVVERIKESEIEKFVPDLIIYFGGQIVSKVLKKYLRALCSSEQWFVSPEGEYVDTFRSLGTLINSGYIDFLQSICNLTPKKTTSSYYTRWEEKLDELLSMSHDEIEEVPYSDLSVFKTLNKLLLKDDILFIGNSSVVRYMQLFNPVVNAIYSNRGTSGIDGCLSTASGIAFSESNKVIAVLGDLSFVYDSNGLWNRRLPQNLKIIVVNNQGGNIFGIIEGPDSLECYQDLCIAYHPVNIEHLVRAFGLGFFKCDTNADLTSVFNDFYNHSGCAVLEVKTSGDINPGIFRNFVNKLKS